MYLAIKYCALVQHVGLPRIHVYLRADGAFGGGRTQQLRKVPIIFDFRCFFDGYGFKSVNSD